MAIRAPLEIPSEDGPDRDRALIQAHVGGDQSAFQQLVLGHYQSMLGHAFRRLHDAQAAEDAVQDSLVRAYRSLGASHEDYRLGPWLHRIVDNVCTDEAARRHREYEATRRFQADLVVLRPVEDESPDLEYVSAAIAALPPGYRDALMMRDVLELEYADVAEQAGISEQNARARVSRARAALRKLVASTVTAWLVIGRFLRRGTIGTPKLIREVSASAATLPQEAVVNSTRGISAASTIALTAVAVASVAAPALVAGSPGSPSSSRDSGSMPVTAGPRGAATDPVTWGPSVGPQAYTLASPPTPAQGHARSAGAPTTTAAVAHPLVPRVVAAAPSPTTTVVITTVDANQPAYPSWTGTTVPAPAGDSIPSGDLTTPSLRNVAGPHSDSLSGAGSVGWSSAGATGDFSGALATPESRCGSAIGGTLQLLSPSGAPWRLRFVGELTSAWSDASSSGWGFVGQVNAAGYPDYEGSGWIQGHVEIRPDNTVQITGHMWGLGEAAAPEGPGSCHGASGSAPSTTTTQSSPTTVGTSNASTSSPPSGGPTAR